jgi:hypothetical protein
MVISTGLFVFRSQWITALENVLPEQAYERIRPSSFSNDIESGLTSEAFSLTGNVISGDRRAGLEDAAKKDILRIMKLQNVTFDEARRIQLEQKLIKNGIALDGRPTDPRAVFFS